MLYTYVSQGLGHLVRGCLLETLGLKPGIFLLGMKIHQLPLSCLRTELLKILSERFHIGSQNSGGPGAYMKTASLSTTCAGLWKGKPYSLWTRYLYNTSKFFISFTDVYSRDAPSDSRGQGSLPCSSTRHDHDEEDDVDEISLFISPDLIEFSISKSFLRRLNYFCTRDIIPPGNLS